MKIVAASLMILFVIVSCTSEKQSMTKSLFYTPSSLATTISQPISTVTPKTTLPSTFVEQASQFSGSSKPFVTATPIPFDPSSENVTRIIDSLFDKQICTKLDFLTPVAPTAPQYFLGYQIGKPEFIEITNQVDFSKVLIEEIADNTQKVFGHTWSMSQNQQILVPHVFNQESMWKIRQQSKFIKLIGRAIYHRDSWAI
jgi:hypothetical protein